VDDIAEAIAGFPQ
jgi:hypothetical protein